MPGLIVLASAARTADAASSAVSNFGDDTTASILQLLVDHTASGGAISLTPSIEVQEPVGGSWVPYWTAAAALTALGTYAYLIYQRSVAFTSPSFPVAAGSLKEVIGRPLHRCEWRFKMVHGNANSQTYSVGGYWMSEP